MPELPSVFSLMLHAAGLKVADFAARYDGHGSITLDALTVEGWASDPKSPPPTGFLDALAGLVGRDPRIRQSAIDSELDKASVGGELTLEVPKGRQPWGVDSPAIDLEWIFLGCVCAQALQRGITPVLVGID